VLKGEALGVAPAGGASTGLPTGLHTPPPPCVSPLSIAPNLADRLLLLAALAPTAGRSAASPEKRHPER